MCGELLIRNPNKILVLRPALFHILRERTFTSGSLWIKISQFKACHS